jgi:hypothetical protein
VRQKILLFIFYKGGVNLSDKIIAAHMESETNVEYVIYPAHKERKESAEFGKSKKQLKKDEHYKCWICGCTEHLEVHHLFEFSLAEALDFKKIKEVLRVLDFYGYSERMKDLSFTSIDDIRNMLVLCAKHHRSEYCSIHEISFPAFLSMRCVKDGMQTVPQSKEDLDKLKNK